MKSWALTLILYAVSGCSSTYAQSPQIVYHTFTSAVNNTGKEPYTPPPGMTYNYYKHLGAACKAELYFEKKTQVPLKIRVGTIEQSDYLEQKPNTRIYNR